MTTPAQKSSIDTRKGWHKLTYTLSSHVPWSLTQAARAMRAVRTTSGKR